MKEQQNKKVKTGIILSDKMDKTVVVLVENMVKHPVFKKYVRQRRKFTAHDEKNDCRVGDQVEIIECRPLSKRKRWRVTNIIKRGESLDVTQGVELV
ncbi:MAG: 30S ribosomal protein S17 [Pseudomonadota bacterium]